MKKLDAVHFFSQNEEVKNQLGKKDLVEKYLQVLKQAMNESKISKKILHSIGQSLLLKNKCLMNTEYLCKLKFKTTVKNGDYINYIIGATRVVLLNNC